MLEEKNEREEKNVIISQAPQKSKLPIERQIRPSTVWYKTVIETPRFVGQLHGSQVVYKFLWIYSLGEALEMIIMKTWFFPKDHHHLPHKLENYSEYYFQKQAITKKVTSLFCH